VFAGASPSASRDAQKRRRHDRPSPIVPPLTR
jgi:hypothetical protein